MDGRRPIREENQGFQPPENEEYVNYFYNENPEFWYQQEPLEQDYMGAYDQQPNASTSQPNNAGPVGGPQYDFQPQQRPQQPHQGQHQPTPQPQGMPARQQIPTRLRQLSTEPDYRLIPSVTVSPALAPTISPALAPVPLEPIDSAPMDLEQQLFDTLEQAPEPEPQESDFDHDHRLRRQKYKATSSIPPDLNRTQYATQCIAAATSSRLPPFQLHPNEYNVLRNSLSLRHVTTYLNIRNGILRLWTLNPTVAVTMVEAAGCARAPRFYVLAEFAFEWLVRNGFINHGCCLPGTDVPPSLSGVRAPPPTQRRKPRQTIVVVGAGVAGLAAARQLENLCQVYRAAFYEHADIPKILVLESRNRLGGRIHSVRTQQGAIAELGASTIPGFGGGNPMGTVLRRQLGLPAIPVEAQDDMYNADTGELVDSGINYRAHELFGHLLDRMATFDSGPAPATAQGDKLLIQAGRDPPHAASDADELRTIADSEERTKSYHGPNGSKRASAAAETAIEMKFLQELGYTPTTDINSSQVHITARPSGGSPSLGKTMDALLEQLAKITTLTEEDIRCLAWYYAKFEYLIGDCIDKVSLSSWSHYRTNRFTGQHSWIRDGLTALPRALASTPSELDVRYQTEVKIIEYEDEEGVQLQLGNGDQVKADKVIVTVPLGVLKKRAIQFIPDLPQWKTDSIERLGFGNLNKVVLAFNKCFWDPQPFTFRVMQKNEPESRGECFMFQNLMPATGHPVLTALVSGEAANALAEMDDSVIIDRALESLKRMFKPDEDVKLVESFVSRWQLDPHSYGVYSYVGVDGTIVDHDLLGRPVQQSLFFAGEGTSRFYPGTVHGAYLSGLRVGKEVMNSLIGSLEVPECMVQSVESDRINRRPSPLNMPESQRPSARSTPQGNTPRGPFTGGYPPSFQPTYKARTQTPVSVEELEQELSTLRKDREKGDEQHMERDLLNELGERPTKPERSGNTNPFLLFQKDYWDICRKETEDLRKGHASRNEIRALLGKRWKSLPEDEKRPYMDRTQKTKENNEQQIEEYVRKVKWYDSEADNFRRQWKIEHPSKHTDREKELVSIIQEINPRPKRHRLTD